MEEQNGLICAYLLDGKGGGKEVGWEFIRGWSPQDGALWVHLKRENSEAQRWLYEEANLDNPIFWYIIFDESIREILGEPTTFEVTEEPIIL